MGEEIKIWYDEEGDYFEVLFEQKAGYFRETENDAVMEKVDEEGNLIGFSILKVSALKEQKPLSISLKSHVGQWHICVKDLGDPNNVENIFIPARKNAGVVSVGDWSECSCGYIYAPAGGAITRKAKAP